MRPTMLVGLCLAVTAGAAGGDDDVTQLIDRALKAHGGADRLAQPRAYTVVVEMTSKSRRAPAGVSSTATHSFQPPNQYRLEEDAVRGGRPSKYVEVYNGNRGWTKRDGVLQPMAAKTAAQPPDVELGFGYKFILCLRDRNTTATALGASKVGTTAAFGIKLTRPLGRGSEERRLYFDAETGLLLKSELHARLSIGGELASEQTWADWKMIDGIAVPHRVTNAIRDAGGTVHERVFSDFKFADKLDAKLFDRP
jgi:outer membrane lipoprotein-sorting protein